MAAVETPEAPALTSSGVDSAFIDCDVHYDPRSLADDLAPYMAQEWRRYVLNRGFSSAPSLPYALWQGPERREVEPPEGEGRASMSFELLKRTHLDAWDVEYAIIAPGRFLGATYLPQREFALALAAAHNDFTVDHWLSRDERLRGSVFVTAQDAVASAREIDRMGGHPSMVQVVLPTRSPGGIEWGDEKYHPIWEAAVRNDLAVAFHLVGAAGDVPPPTTYGWPRSYMELAATYPIAAQCELTSLLCRGVFEKFPALRVVFIENGFAWLPALLWQLDKKWRELRAEVPWLKRPPSAYAHEQIRFTTQPMCEPGKREHLPQLIDMLGSDEMLLFSTDWPHWDFDAPTRTLPSNLPKDLRSKILSENARTFYGLPPAAAESDR